MRAQEPNRKIKIGYHCAFMDSDTIRFQMGSILRNHDRSRFHITGYSALRTISDDIRSAFDEMRSTRGLPKEQFAELVRNDQIDVLVELTGFSPGHRFRALALRCAPIQVSYLNHTGTSGVANVDYVLADDICVPAEEDRFFTEKVWRLPGSFFCFNYDSEDRPLPGPPPSIQAGHVTFGCFGSGPKINDELIAIWSRILHRVPGSVLFVKNGQMTPPDNRQFMLERFRRHGIDEGRLRVEGGASRSTIMDCYSSIDISLDTWPYSGGNTIAESIWQGVPVVTLKGDRFSSRYGASLVSAAGCADLIGDTAAQYEEVAVGLAHSPDRLSYLRQNLRSMAKRFGLCDAENFSRKLEEAYVGMLSVRDS
jgi:predicted O-linked N-acetylglucosamine transferase (SPINDLY family)